MDKVNETALTKQVQAAEGGSIQTWREEVFLPWKREAGAVKNYRAEVQGKLLNKARSLRQVIAFLLEKREEEATALWNSLDVPPKMSAIQVDLTSENVTFNTAAGQRETVQLDVLLADLQAMFNTVR